MKEYTRSPDLAELIRMAIRASLAEVHVSLPGRIEAYNAAEQKADIQPLLKRPLVTRDGTELSPESLPILMDVPVVFPRGGAGAGAFFLSWPLEAGDLVQLIFIERSTDQYLAGDGDETTPLDFRMHSLSDAVAYPGLYPRSRSLADADPDNAVLGRDGGMQLHFTPGDIAEFRVGGVADVSAAIAETLQAWWDSTVKPALDTWGGAHTHISAAPGSPSAPPLPALSTPSLDAGIISDNLKLKGN